METEGLSDLPRVQGKERKYTQTITFFYSSTDLFLEHLLCDKYSAKYWEYSTDKTVVIATVSQKGVIQGRDQGAVSIVPRAPFNVVGQTKHAMNLEMKQILSQ